MRVAMKAHGFADGTESVWGGAEGGCGGILPPQGGELHRSSRLAMSALLRRI